MILLFSSSVLRKNSMHWIFWSVSVLFLSSSLPIMNLAEVKIVLNHHTCLVEEGLLKSCVYSNQQLLKRQIGYTCKWSRTLFTSSINYCNLIFYFSSASSRVCFLSWDVPVQHCRYLRSWKCGKMLLFVMKEPDSMGRYGMVKFDVLVRAFFLWIYSHLLNSLFPIFTCILFFASFYRKLVNVFFNFSWNELFYIMKKV